MNMQNLLVVGSGGGMVTIFPFSKVEIYILKVENVW
jgi:hypothetical protein